jgi:dihydroxyacetone kinase
MGMTNVFNNPRDFREEMIDGYVAAYSRHLRRVPGASGVIAAGAPALGKVAVIVGGGSGHYPAFFGLVGAGMPTAAVIGDIFTSPSGEQAYRVGKAADGGAGVLFSFGNYSGDVMNFGLAEERLRAEGIDCRTVLVTDDVLSAPAAEIARRRGIAGGFYVFKSAGASAARGDDLATVERYTRHANDRVRTVGVAFGGCTVPGQTEPLFTVEAGRMEVGLGIHGEPGVRTSDRVTARELAALLVEQILADAPADAGSEVAVLVNGLGATKYEELFVLYSSVAPLLARAGLRVHETNIGEFVTSLDMAGCSLSLLWLDDDLRALHDAPASAPAYTRFGTDGSTLQTFHARDATDVTAPETTPVDDAGVPGVAGSEARNAIRRALVSMEAHETELARLDAAAGDGDHGAGMVRGFTAAVDALGDAPRTARSVFLTAGRAFQDTAGGASGALVGGLLVAIGSALPEHDTDVDAASWASAVENGLAGVMQLGGSAPGDKTMVDTLHPFARALRAEVARSGHIETAWAAALPAAEAGMRSTVEIVSRRGRASRLGERSRGHQDAGATSIYYVLQSFGEALSGPD